MTPFPGTHTLTGKLKAYNDLPLYTNSSQIILPQIAGLPIASGPQFLFVWAGCRRTTRFDPHLWQGTFYLNLLFQLLRPVLHSLHLVP